MEGFRRAVLEFLVRQQALSEALRSRMLGWRYSGFSAHNQVRLGEEENFQVMPGAQWLELLSAARPGSLRAPGALRRVKECELREPRARRASEGAEGSGCTNHVRNAHRSRERVRRACQGRPRPGLRTRALPSLTTPFPTSPEAAPKQGGAEPGACLRMPQCAQRAQDFPSPDLSAPKSRRNQRSDARSPPHARAAGLRCELLGAIVAQVARGRRLICLSFPKGFGRIRIRQIERGDYENLMPFIKASVSPGALIHSDGSPAYRDLEESGYKHRRTVHLGSDTPAHESMPGVHRVASLL